MRQTRRQFVGSALGAAALAGANLPAAAQAAPPDMVAQARAAAANAKITTQALRGNASDLCHVIAG